MEDFMPSGSLLLGFRISSAERLLGIRGGV
jgi:hypothetical protein